MCTYLLEGFLFLEGRQNAGTKMLSLAGKHSKILSMQSKAARTFSLHPLEGQTSADEHEHRCMQCQAQKQAETAISRRGHYKNYRFRDPDSRNTNEQNWRAKWKNKLHGYSLHCFQFADKKYALALLAKEWHIKGCPKWGAAAFLHSAGTRPPSTLFWKINFAKTKAVLARALKSLTKPLISQFKYMYISILKLPINFKHVHSVLW